MQERRLDLVAQGEIRQRLGVVPFEEEEEQSAQEQENRVGDECELRRKRPLLHMASTPPHVEHHGKADSADDGAEDNGQGQRPIARIRSQSVAHDDEAAVVEDRDGHEGRVPQRGQHGVALADEKRREGEEEDRLRAEGDDDDGPHKQADFAQARLRLRSRQEALRQADAPRHHDSQNRGHHHDAQPADHHPYGDEELPQRRPVGGGVHSDEPGHAHRRGRREESVDKGGALARRGRRRQREQRRLDEDDPREHEKGQARGRIAGDVVHSLPRPEEKPGCRGRAALSPHSLVHDGRSLLLPDSRLAFFRARGLWEKESIGQDYRHLVPVGSVGRPDPGVESRRPKRRNCATRPGDGARLL